MSCNTLQNALSLELILQAKDTNTLKQLLMNGASIHYQSQEGWCLLLDTGANIEATDPYHNTALNYAQMYKNEMMTQLLISRGAVLSP